MDHSGSFKLGTFTVLPEDNLIAGPGGEIRVEPKSMDVLMVLVRAQGRTVSRDDIVSVVWPRGFVSDDVLTRCIGQLRKALGDSSRSPEHLTTIRKRGYKLVTPVEHEDPEPPPALAAAPGILVLPLQNLSRQEDDAYVADGLSELITASLAGVSELRVISRTTAMSLGRSGAPLATIARQANARWVVEGSVVIAGSQARVVVQLIDASQDAHVLAETFASTIDELLDLQMEIADRISAKVNTAVDSRLAPEKSQDITVDESILREYLKGRSLLSRRTADALADASTCFKTVLSSAPKFSEAHAALAEAQMLRAHYGAERVSEVRQEIDDHLSQALALEPANASAFYCRGAVRLFFDRNLDLAELDLRRALSLQASHSMAALCMANICAVRRDFGSASAWMQQALLINPMDVGLNMNLGDHLLLQSQYAPAADQFSTTLAIDSQHWPTRLRLAWALALADDIEAATQELEEARQDTPVDAVIHEYAALVSAACGNPVDAAQHYGQLVICSETQFVTPWALARAAAAAEEFEAMYQHLDDALTQNNSSLLFFHLTPAFNAVLDDKRAKILANRIFGRT